VFYRFNRNRALQRTPQLQQTTKRDLQTIQNPQPCTCKLTSNKPAKLQQDRKQQQTNKQSSNKNEPRSGSDQTTEQRRPTREDYRRNNSQNSNHRRRHSSPPRTNRWREIRNKRRCGCLGHQRTTIAKRYIEEEGFGCGGERQKKGKRC